MINNYGESSASVNAQESFSFQFPPHLMQFSRTGANNRPVFKSRWSRCDLVFYTLCISHLSLVLFSSRRSSTFQQRPPSVPRGKNALSLHAPIPTLKDHGRRFTLSRLTSPSSSIALALSTWLRLFRFAISFYRLQRPLRAVVFPRPLRFFFSLDLTSSSARATSRAVASRAF